jgi:hypothetical protein
MGVHRTCRWADEIDLTATHQLPGATLCSFVGRPWMPLEGFNLTVCTNDPGYTDAGTLPNIPAV